jgi:hypothetical protein
MGENSSQISLDLNQPKDDAAVALAEPAYANVTTDFFGGSAYPLSERTICSSATGDRLSIFGALKEKTIIDPPDITVGYLPSPTAGRLSVHYAAALDILRFVDAAFECRPSVFYTRPPHV